LCLACGDVNALQQRKAECGSLSCSCLCQCDDVAAIVEELWYYSLLYTHRLDEAKFVDSFPDGVVDTQFFKICHIGSKILKTKIFLLLCFLGWILLPCLLFLLKKMTGRLRVSC